MPGRPKRSSTKRHVLHAPAPQAPPGSRARGEFTGSVRVVKPLKKLAIASALAAGVTIVSGCSGTPDDSASRSKSSTTIPHSSTSTTRQVDASIYRSPDGFYRWTRQGAEGERGCSIFDGPAGYRVSCAVQLTNTPPVTQEPFGAQTPDTVSLDDRGTQLSLAQAVLPTGTLDEGDTITVGDITCTALDSTGGIECDKGTNGFRYKSGELTIRGTAFTPATSASSTSTSAPQGVPYTEGTTPAAPGTDCGAATGDIVVQVVEGSISCTDALAVMKRYLALPDDGTHGNANIRSFDGWSCSSPTAARSEQLQYANHCIKGDIELTTPR